MQPESPPSPSADQLLTAEQIAAIAAAVGLRTAASHSEADGLYRIVVNYIMRHPA